MTAPAVSAATAGSPPGAPDPRPGLSAGRAGHDVGWWGMMVLLATEAALFSYLLASYFYVGVQHPSWPSSGPLPLALVAPNTALLVASSGAAWWADRGAQAGRRGRLIGGLALTIAMGAVFLGVQSVEWSRLEFRPQTDAYGSLFFTITGLHGLHVFAGLLALTHALLRALTGAFAPGRTLEVNNVILYWHFVDVVWLVVFTSLYLAPRF